LENLQTPNPGSFVRGEGESQRYWEMHRDCLRLMRESIRLETLPVVAMGDWNHPDHGPLYREITGGLRDAHREAGWGYGWTFPDDMSSVLAGGGPWLRLDYILTSPAWQVMVCEVEADAEQAQHRAVAAVLVLP
jgi:endonuclease/exonuclease/phosphatase family metal-dependent hydrolase